jgi:hypothetical protein
VNTTSDSSSPAPGEKGPPPSGAPGLSRKTSISIFIGTMLVVGTVNYFLFRAFSPAASPRRVVAGFRADFLPDKPKEGWRYLWNANGPIGNATNYAELRWNGTYYVADEIAPFPNPPPARYLKIRETGGHPGHGPAQRGASEEHFVITAFTVPERGRYWITNSFLARGAGGKSGSIYVQIYANDTEAGRSVDCRTREGVSFDREVGRLSAGDVIYVAVGPHEVDLEDGFELDFTIVR